ncbi:hypothetical protein JCM17843_11290 [Kordiimonadales bacterium JCM 17843]|nr:hypothetical protein JCM17843_11290 [Kordiimonadales bacterium JCM 17843]
MRAAIMGMLGRLRYDHSILFVLAIGIGTLAGYGAIGFRLLINAWGYLAFGASEEQLIAGIIRLLGGTCFWPRWPVA